MKTKVLGKAYPPDSVSIYMQETRKFPLLKEWEEKELAKKMKKGDREAKERFIGSNLRLVTNIAARYIRSGMEFKDLIAYGNIGLIKAVDKFDPKKGCKFSTYATWWIRQAIERSLADCGTTIRLPSYVVANILKVDRATRALLAKGIITKEDLAETTQLSLSRLEKTMRVMRLREVQSLEQSPFEDGISLGERLEDDSKPLLDETILAKERKTAMESMLDKMLTGQEAAILRLRFGFNETQEISTLDEIGKQYGVTRERIRQIEAKALRKLKHALAKKKNRPLKMALTA